MAGFGQYSVACNSYSPNGLGIESQWMVDFPHLSRLALGPKQPPAQWVTSHSQQG